MKPTIFALLAVMCLALSGCVEAYAETEVAMPVGTPQYGCTIVADTYGEREVCGVNYYVVEGGVVYFDPYYHIWIGPRGYWYGGRYVVGYAPGYYARYGGYYRYHGYYGGRSPGYWHGGGYHGNGGSFHGGGGFRGGGHHR
jgi:hypothetical protein